LTKLGGEELDGTTLCVYAYLVKEGRAVGPREVMRGANLNSSSVAHWHLQKLESLELVAKNEYGEYVAKDRVGISGHWWFGRRLVPRLIFYAFFFMGIFVAEISVILIPFLLRGQIPEMYLFYVAAPTGIATVLFLFEGLWLRKKIAGKHQEKN
jgi:hypothetical protein